MREDRTKRKNIQFNIFFNKKITEIFQTAYQNRGIRRLLEYIIKMSYISIYIYIANAI